VTVPPTITLGGSFGWPGPETREGREADPESGSESPSQESERVRMRRLRTRTNPGR
jgi:hypothetical protein